MIGTSPPKQNERASVTLSARIVAAPASAALPPRLRISIPACTASRPPAATTPFPCSHQSAYRGAKFGPRIAPSARAVGSCPQARAEMKV